MYVEQREKEVRAFFCILSKQLGTPGISGNQLSVIHQNCWLGSRGGGKQFGEKEEAARERSLSAQHAEASSENVGGWWKGRAAGTGGRELLRQKEGGENPWIPLCSLSRGGKGSHLSRESEQLDCVQVAVALATRELS